MWSRRPSPSRRSRWFSAVVSGTLDLLDGPQVAVRILKEDVGRAHRSLGPELLDIAGWDSAPGERLPRGIDVLDHQLDTLDRAGFAERQPPRRSQASRPSRGASPALRGHRNDLALHLDD